MWRVTWRNLFARKLRLLLSAFAIVLGVAFVAGTLIFTNAMGGAFDDIIEGSTADVEVAFKGANDFDSGQDNRTFPASVVSELEALPEVGSANPQNTLQTVFVIGKDGKVIGGNGPPGLAINPTDADSLTGKPILTVVRGDYPSGPDQIALDVDAAEKGDFEIGDKVELATPGQPPVMEAKLTGLVEFGSGGLNGATLTVFDSRFMQERFYGGRDVFGTVSLNAAEGVSQRELANAAQKVLPAGVVARTGDAYVEKNKASLDEILGFLQTFLLVFAAVSLIVGVFIIINTFSILVAQRSRELALLRAMGASRRQVNGSVLLEATAVGLLGSTVGLGVGYLLALGLRWLFGVFGLDLSRADFPMTWQAVFWSYVVGVGVTAIAALLPARRAARIAPMAALRDDVALPESTMRRRVLIGTVLVLVGAGAMAAGLRGEGTCGTVRHRRRHRARHRRRVHHERLPGAAGAPPVRRGLPPHVRDGRSAGGPERPAQPASHRRDGQRPDDRAGPDVDDVDLRQLGVGEHRRRHRQVADLAVHRVQRRRPAVLDRRRRAGTPPRRRLRRDPAAQRLPRAQGRRQRLDGRRRPEGVRARLHRPHGRGLLRRAGSGHGGDLRGDRRRTRASGSVTASR